MSSRIIFTSETALVDLLLKELEADQVHMTHMTAQKRQAFVDRVLAQVSRLSDQPGVVQRRVTDRAASVERQADDVLQAQLQFLEAKLGYEVGVLNGAINSLAEKVLRLEQQQET